MALKIRLSRFGTKNEPHFRVLVTERRAEIAQKAAKARWARKKSAA